MVTSREIKKVTEGAPLERCLGSTTQIKIVDALSIFRSFDFSIEEIAGNAEINAKSVRRVLPGLLRYGIVEKSRRVGRNTMYRYNVNNSIAKKLNAFIADVAAFDALITAEQELTQKDQSQEQPQVLLIPSDERRVKQ